MTALVTGSWSSDSWLSNCSNFSPQVSVFQTEVAQVPGVTEPQRMRVAKNRTSLPSNEKAS